MSQATQVAGSIAKPLERSLRRPVWTGGIYAAAAWAAAAIVTKALPDVVPWGSNDLFALLTGLGAVAIGVLAIAGPLLSLHHGKRGRRLLGSHQSAAPVGPAENHIGLELPAAHCKVPGTI